jgi:hypothetical protein
VGDGVWGCAVVFFIVNIYDIDGGDEWSAYFEDLDIWVRTYLGSGGDSKMWVVAGHIGSCAVRFSVTAGGGRRRRKSGCVLAYLGSLMLTSWTRMMSLFLPAVFSRVFKDVVLQFTLCEVILM